MKNNKVINNLKIKKLINPKYIKPLSVSYEEDGVKKTWEVVKSHDSVAILLYHEEKNCFLFVKQFRPPVYLNNNNGITVELCAGLVDKSLDLIDIAREEIEEECGYKVENKNIERVTSFYTAVGFSGGCQTLFYSKINEKMKIHEGGGIDNEMIELFYLDISETKKFILDESI
uniref:NUDIX domain-containing protein n=1 Tax=Halarcobacter sp. TaxID=2321133 RepID=UPI003A95DB1C